ncbi:MAG: hypothetical protein GF418_14670 [Chitinivibrionales bacterium]|nr:hypothetical protein [Chitinivibrionales bacterium]MBD3396863.1 hypothetical protein [Chitinivibrionales bacterium]
MRLSTPRASTVSLALCLCLAGTALSPRAATITSPEDGIVFVADSTYTLTGTGTDLEWSYDANSDGTGEVSIGGGESVEFTVPNNVTGAKTIDIFLRGSDGDDQISGTIGGGGGSTTGLDIDCGNYRIALSHDGNANDLDDIVAAPLALAIIAEAGLTDKFVFMDYSNHVCGDGPSMQVEGMQESVPGACERWDIDVNKTFEVRIPSVYEEAKTAFAEAATAAYEAGDRLYYACGGPMEVPYQMVSQLSQEVRDNITVISHSTWNDNHSFCGHTWSDLTPLCESIHIDDQNSACWNKSEGEWQWLADKGGKYEWLFNRNLKSSWDGSDAGMTFFIITGRGNSDAVMADAQELFNNDHSCEAVAVDRPARGTTRLAANHAGASTRRNARAFSLDGRLLGTVRLGTDASRLDPRSLPRAMQSRGLQAIVVRFDNGHVRRMTIVRR